VEGAGGNVLWERPNGVLTFTIPRSGGGTTYCELRAVANLGQQYLTIIDEKSFKPRMSFGKPAKKTKPITNSQTMPTGQTVDVSGKTAELRNTDQPAVRASELDASATTNVTSRKRGSPTWPKVSHQASSEIRG